MRQLNGKITTLEQQLKHTTRLKEKVEMELKTARSDEAGTKVSL